MDYIIICIFWVLLSWLGWKAWKAFRTRRGIRTAIYTMLTALMLWGGLEIGLVPGAAIYHHLSITNRLFGTPFLLEAPSFSHHTERSFHGDGFSMTVYSLSEAQVRHLREAGPDLFKRPEEPDYRDTWQKVPWQRSPMKKDEARYLHFCKDWPGESNVKAEEIVDQIESALAGTDCLYSYNYNENGEEKPYLADVDFYFVDFKRRLLILLNHQS